MKYREVVIKVNKEQLELLEAELLGEGFESYVIDDPADGKEILENKALYKYDYINEEIGGDPERRPSLTLYFADDEDGEAEMDRLLGMSDGFRREMDAEVAVKDSGDDSEWLYKWQEHFKPAKVGNRIVVKPGWEAYEPAEGELVIEMDPGMAFGSGLHETTSMCIKALEKYMPALSGEKAGIGVAAQGQDADAGKDVGCEAAAVGCDGPCRARVLDVGTGTGILAIAAALLGAADCLGIDIDDEAVRVAGENTARNGVGDTVAIAKGDLMEGVDFDADIIVANLMADLVMKLAPSAAAQLKSGGIFISSGIIDDKEETVAGALRSAGFEIKEIMRDGEWRAITAVRI